MRIDPRMASLKTQQAGQASRTLQPRPAAAKAGAESPAPEWAGAAEALRLAGPIGDAVQGVRTGSLASSAFEQRLTEIASQLVRPIMSDADKARAIHLVARIASLEHQLVERLRPEQGSGGEMQPPIDQMINDWAVHYADGIGLQLRAPGLTRPGSIFDGRI